LLVVFLALIGCATVPVPRDGVHLNLRASKVMAFPGAPILLTAELSGDAEPEGWYCPRVVWTWPDGTESGVEGDCPPYAERVDYPRRWTQWKALAAPGTYPIRVRLERAGKVIARQELVLTGLGGE
jgi:hypothetical protein